MRWIEVTEGTDFPLGKSEAERLRAAADLLRAQLRPSFPFLKEQSGRIFNLTNIVGSIDIGGGLGIQVAPKVSASTDWPTAVVSLLSGNEGVHLAGDRLAGRSRARPKNLLDAVSSAYLARLQRAFRQEGPLVIMERARAELPYLQGALDVTKWAQTAVWRPQVFPVTRTSLLSDNPFTRTLVFVAKALARASSHPKVRSGLTAISRDLAGGGATDFEVPAGATSLSLPSQWNAYKPAWSLAQALLQRTSLLGVKGRHVGMGVAVEAWPLLETLLERTLRSVQQQGRIRGRKLSYRMQGSVNLLRPRGEASPFSSAPDGRLFEDGRILASFEAKYSRFNGLSPQREHIYQALATAAACEAPIAVLVYPGSFRHQVWDTSGFGGTPRHLIALGLDLFRWYPPSEADIRGIEALGILDTVPGT